MHVEHRPLTQTHRKAGATTPEAPGEGISHLSGSQLVYWPISALWKLGTSLRLFPAPSKPVPRRRAATGLAPLDSPCRSSPAPAACEHPRGDAAGGCVGEGLIQAAAKASPRALAGLGLAPLQHQPGSATPSPPAAVPGHGRGRGAGTRGCISPPGWREDQGGVYLRDVGGEGGTGNRLACKWDFWEVESWRAFSLELS